MTSDAEIPQKGDVRDGWRVVLAADIIENTEAQTILAMWSLGIVVAGAVVALSFALFSGVVPWGFGWWVLLVLVHIVTLPVHELIHAAMFKLLGPRGTRVRFGYESGMLYAGCPGTKMERGRFLVVLFAPFVVVTLAYVVMGIALGDPLVAWCLFVLHTAGCTGDFHFARLVLSHPEASMCEDTEVGITLWEPVDSALG